MSRRTTCQEKVWIPDTPDLTRIHCQRTGKMPIPWSKVNWANSMDIRSVPIPELTIDMNLFVLSAWVYRLISCFGSHPFPFRSPFLFLPSSLSFIHSHFHSHILIRFYPSKTSSFLLLLPGGSEGKSHQLKRLSFPSFVHAIAHNIHLQLNLRTLRNSMNFAEPRSP